VADVAEPHVVGRVEAGIGSQVALRETPEGAVDDLEMLAPEGLASHCSPHGTRALGGATPI
jgi:hypothetical protein